MSASEALDTDTGCDNTTNLCHSLHSIQSKYNGPITIAGSNNTRATEHLLEEQISNKGSVSVNDCIRSRYSDHRATDILQPINKLTTTAIGAGVFAVSS